MTIRQWDRREELRGELLDLIVEMMALGRTAEGQNTPEFRRLDQQLTEKNAELEALNALCSDPNELRELKYRRSVRENHDFLRVIQIFLIVGLFACPSRGRLFCPVLFRLMKPSGGRRGRIPQNWTLRLVYCRGL